MCVAVCVGVCVGNGVAVCVGTVVAVAVRVGVTVLGIAVGSVPLFVGYAPSTAMQYVGAVMLNNVFVGGLAHRRVDANHVGQIECSRPVPAEFCSEDRKKRTVMGYVQRLPVTRTPAFGHKSIGKQRYRPQQWFRYTRGHPTRRERLGAPHKQYPMRQHCQSAEERPSRNRHEWLILRLIL